MSVFFSPDGALNVAHDPSDLPQAAGEGGIQSGAMTRCKNLRLDERGKARTRDGSAKLNTTALADGASWLEVQGGTRYAFAGGSIYRDETSITSGLSNADWSAIQYNAYNDSTQQIFALNGTDRVRISGSTVAEWGLEPPTVAPTLTGGNGVGLTGAVNAKYTYVRKVGSVVVAESDPSPAASAPVTLNNQSLAATVTQPTDSQVTHIRLYRTEENGEVYYFDSEIAISLSYAYGATQTWEADGTYVSGTGNKCTTTSGTDEWLYSWEPNHASAEESGETGVHTVPFGDVDTVTSDADLGDLLETDHDRPPLGTHVFGPAYDGTCFILKANLLYYSKPRQPEYWPATYYVEVSTPQQPGVCGVFHNGQPYVLTKNEIIYVQGTGHNTFLPLPMKAKCGAMSRRGAVSVAGKGIFHIGPDGIYLFGSGTDVKISEDVLEPIFRGETVHGLPGVGDLSTAWVATWRNRLYFGYAADAQSYPANVLVMNLDTGRLAYYIYNDGSEVQIRTFAIDHTNNRLLVADSVGYVRVIESSDYTTDSGTAIPFEIESKQFMLQTRRHFPRWVKYDVDASSATTCAGYLLLDGVVHQTHTLSENRNIRRRLVGTGNGSKASVRISGSGPVAIYAAEFE